MKETSKYYLRKPERGTRPDPVDIEDLNYNADIIDGEMDRLETAKTDRTEFNEHKTAEIIDHPNGSVTDAKIGNRTIGSNTANLTELLNDLANEIKVVKGTGDWEQEPQTDLTEAKAHIENRGNPHGVTKAQVGLANVDDTSDKNKPLSDAAIKALAEKVNVSDIVQETGTGEDKLMSQKAVTDALDKLIGGDLDLSGYVQISDIVQETGADANKLMSQKAVTDALGGKVASTQIVQTTGTGTTNVMSQKAVTDALGVVCFKAYRNAAQNIVNTNTTVARFPNVLVNKGGFTIQNEGYITVPENGVYLITFNAGVHSGSEKYIRFFLRPDASSTVGCTMTPNNTTTAEFGGFVTIWELAKNAQLYVEITPQSTCVLNYTEISITKLPFII